MGSNPKHHDESPLRSFNIWEWKKVSNDEQTKLSSIHLLILIRKKLCQGRCGGHKFRVVCRSFCTVLMAVFLNQHVPCYLCVSARVSSVCHESVVNLFL